jgi:hypothetical protein
VSLLRLFPAYRALEADLRAAQVEGIKLGIQAEGYRLTAERAESEIAQLNKRIDELQEARVTEAKLTTDFVAETRYGRAVFDRVSEIPVPMEDMEPMRTTRPQAADLVRRAEAAFYQQLNAQATEQATTQ